MLPDLVFDSKSSLKISKWETPKPLKVDKTTKNSLPKRTRNQDLQKDSVWKGSNLWNSFSLRHFQLFSQRQRAVKVKLRLRASQIIIKSRKKTASQKNTKESDYEKLVWGSILVPKRNLLLGPIFVASGYPGAKMPWVSPKRTREGPRSNWLLFL